MKKREVGVRESDELVALFNSCDALGRRVILEMARRQAAKPETSAPTLSLVVALSGLNQPAHDLKRVINHRPLALVSNSVHAEKA